MKPDVELDLTHATVQIWKSGATVRTTFLDGKFKDGTRDFNFDNATTAAELGYAGTSEGVWRALLDHEILHSLLSDWMWLRASPVLRHESGAEQVAYLERVYEEALVLAFQRYINTGLIHDVLQPFGRVSLYDWRGRAAKWLLAAAT